MWVRRVDLLYDRSYIATDLEFPVIYSLELQFITVATYKDWGSYSAKFGEEISDGGEPAPPTRSIHIGSSKSALKRIHLAADTIVL